jgi:hypothetical protein
MIDCVYHGSREMMNDHVLSYVNVGHDLLHDVHHVYYDDWICGVISNNLIFRKIDLLNNMILNKMMNFHFYDENSYDYLNGVLSFFC